MKKVVEFCSERKDKPLSLSTLQANTTRNIKSLDSVRKYRKHLENNGSKIHYLTRIDNYVFDKYR